MQAKLINETPERTFALVLDAGDEIVSCLERFGVEADLSASQLTAIGALHDVTLGYFDRDRKHYRPHRYAEQLEALSLVGDIAMDGEAPKVHAHIVRGRGDFSTVGGHLLRGNRSAHARDHRDRRTGASAPGARSGKRTGAHPCRRRRARAVIDPGSRAA